jgi:hypothetical protein
MSFDNTSGLTATLQDWLDKLNPIMIKESRQAINGRLFFWGFLSLILIGTIVTVVSSLDAWLGNTININGADIFLYFYGPVVLIGFFITPMTAYKQLSEDMNGKTFELIAITAMTPGQIVRGKFLSSFSQTGIYAAAVFPFLAFSYFLRGIDMLSILFFLVLLILGTAFATIMAICSAAMIKRRGGRNVSNGVLALALLSGVGGMIGLTAELLQWNSLSWYFEHFWDYETLLVTGAFLFMLSTFGALFYTVAVAQLSFESANRSTGPRLVLAIQWLGYTAIMVAVYLENHYSPEVMLFYALSIFSVWFLVGLVSSTEEEVMSRRVFASFPQQPGPKRFLANMFFPGGARGFRFFVIFYALTLGVTLGTVYLEPPSRGLATHSDMISPYVGTVFCAFCYGILYIGIPLAFFRLVLRKAHVRPMAIRVSIIGALVLGTFTTFLIQGFADYRTEDTFLFQLLMIPNPFLTIYEWMEMTWRYQTEGYGWASMKLVILLALTATVVTLNMWHMSKSMKRRPPGMKRAEARKAALHE